MATSLPERPTSLSEWLTYLEGIHPHNIDLGLDRVAEVFARLSLDFSHCQVVTVAGTNGKGSTCACIEGAAIHSKRTVGVYSSPHLIDYRERVRVNQEWVDEASHCQAFDRVEAARGETSLTYFEFGTLAALVILAEANLDLLILEVGLGGRLDAVNVVTPNVAVITTIDLDHSAFLGNTREAVGREKVGIARHQTPLIVGEPRPPQSLIQVTEALHTQTRWLGRDFGVNGSSVWLDQQSWPLPAPLPIHPNNFATALAAVDALGWRQDVEPSKLVTNLVLPGRGQVIQHRPFIMFDVAHNPQAVEYLAERIQSMTYNRLHLVLGMLKDKDVSASLKPFADTAASWYIASLPEPRGLTAKALRPMLPHDENVLEYGAVDAAFAAAKNHADADDVIVVFGSFLTVGAAMNTQ